MEGNVEGFVDFDTSVQSLDDDWGFEAEFAGRLADFAPQPKEPAPVVDEAADLAWLFQQATQKTDLGSVECQHGRVDISDCVAAVVRQLAESGNDSVRRQDALLEAAELRAQCRLTDSWRSGDYSWPLLSD
jgi:hypothetical protein